MMSFNNPSTDHNKPLIIAHRGVSAETPENTMSAFRKAIEYGCPFIELDVQLSKDGVPVVVHDPHLKRTSDVGSDVTVQELTLDQIKQLDAGSWFSEEFRGERIPTLKEVLEMKRGPTGLMIEIKTPKSGEEKKLVETVVAVLKKAPQREDEGEILLGSFSPEVVKNVQEIAPDFAVIGIAKEHQTIDAHRALGVTHFTLHYPLVTAELIEKLHQEGCVVWTYTVNDRATLKKVTEAGVDGVITNDPKEIFKIHPKF